MARHAAARRMPRLESLETRQLLSTGTSDIEQYALEQLNKTRAQPAEAAVAATTNLSPYSLQTFRYYKVDLGATRNAIAERPSVAPLAWNDSLAGAAQEHADDQANNGFQSHQGSDGSSLEDRLKASGYAMKGVYGENAFAYAESVDQAMSAFLVDYGNPGLGHRNAILNGEYKEVGIAVTPTKTAGVGPNVIVQNFGSASDNPYLLGVVYDDNNANGSYDLGEGDAQLTISVTKVDGTNLATARAVASPVDVTPWSSGGYQVQLAPGNYKVVTHRGDRVFSTGLVTIGQDNVKRDFVLTGNWENGSYNPQPVVEAPTPVAATPEPVVVPVTPVAPTPVVSIPRRAQAQSVASPTPTPAPAVVAPVEAKPVVAPTWGRLSWRTWNGVRG